MDPPDGLGKNMYIEHQIAGSRRRLYRVALAWCGNGPQADDLVQDTIELAIKRHHQLRDPAKLYAWLYSILNNCWRRSLQRARPHDEINDDMPAGDSGPVGAAETQETVSRVREAIASLPVKERQVIVLVDLEELPYGDAAIALDIPIGTVMSRLHRARRHLLEKLDAATAYEKVHVGGVTP